MENQILEILKQIQQEQVKTNERLDRIENKIDITYDQVARTAEDVMDIKRDINTVETVTAKNWQDIAKLKTIK